MNKDLKEATELTEKISGQRTFQKEELCRAKTLRQERPGRMEKEQAGQKGWCRVSEVRERGDWPARYGVGGRQPIRTSETIITTSAAPLTAKAHCRDLSSVHTL